MGDWTATDDLSAGPTIESVVLEHAYHGVRLQVLLRGVLIAVFVLTLVVVPPDHDLVACWLIVAGYIVWAALVAWHALRGAPAPFQRAWLDLLVDLATLAALILLAGRSAPDTWTFVVLINSFFLVPILAAAQLRPIVGAVIVGPTVAVYLGSSIATRVANGGEPWGSLLLRTLTLAGVGIGCVALSYIQRSRVTTIGGLVRDRTDLLGELMTLEAHERRSMAESLHDGALQYVLAARQDLEDARELGDPTAFERLERALTESSRLLRSTVSELHPAVLEHAGLAQALRDLASNAAASCRCEIAVELDGWSDELRTPADGLLYTTARELVANVVKHAHASHARIGLARYGDRALLVVADDGSGIPDGAVERSLRHGHIGLASHRVRIEAAGGTVTFDGAQPSGTIVQVDVPYSLPFASAAAPRSPWGIPTGVT